MTSIAITGSRNFGVPDRRDVAQRKVENFVLSLPDDWRIVSGGAAGPDTWAIEAAKMYERDWIEYLPNDAVYSYTAARLERNRDVVENSDILVCFWDEVSTGSLHSFQLMIQARKPAKMVRLSDHLPTIDALRAML